jgi:hypothetical protein
VAEVGLGEITLACDTRMRIGPGAMSLVADFLAVVREILLGLPRFIAILFFFFDDGVFLVDLFDDGR